MDLLNTEQMAALLDLSPQRLRELTRRGAVPRAGHGRYLVAEVVPAYCRHLREAAAGRASSGAGTLDLVQERAALARAQREKLEREARQASRELVDVAEVKAAWFRLTRVARDKLLGVPTRIAPLLGPDAGRAFDVMTAELRQTLEELASEPTTGANPPPEGGDA